MIEINGKYYENAEEIVKAYYSGELGCPELVQAIELIIQKEFDKVS